MGAGELWLYPGNGTGKPSGARRIATNWSGYDAVFGAANLNSDAYPDLVARKSDGSLWSYAGTGMKPSEGYLPRTLALKF